jgi:membrane protease YdiL (CAAX protease family)
MPDGGFLHRFRCEGCTLGILVAAILLVALPLLPTFVVTGLGNRLYPCTFLSYGLMASIPLILMQMAPGAAGFDTQWFPKARLQWLWTLILVLLMFIAGSLAVKLTTYLNLGSHRPYYVPTFTSFSRLTIALNGLLFLVVAPMAEEIFFRGYLLEQLRKLTHWSIALPIHAFVFALLHFVFWVAFLVPIGVFFHAILLGAWRIRLKALLPLIVSHIVINAAAFVPILDRDYQNLLLIERVAPHALDGLRSNPKCQQIAALTRQPAAKALPVLIRFLGDRDAAVSGAASWAITQYRRDEVRPYLRGKKGHHWFPLFLTDGCP